MTKTEGQGQYGGTVRDQARGTKSRMEDRQEQDRGRARGSSHPAKARAGEDQGRGKGDEDAEQVQQQQPPARSWYPGGLSQGRPHPSQQPPRDTASYPGGHCQRAAAWEAQACSHPELHFLGSDPAEPKLTQQAGTVMGTDTGGGGTCRGRPYPQAAPQDCRDRRSH